ncbi:tRNA (adenosine(37)-N6)-threonylcarbamoyltransferase complex dimerization subunit type 1 TsaB [Bacillaceae bacterium S4-13-56]
MNVLAFDTSNQPMSVALIGDGIVVAEQSTFIKKNHSVQLMPAINDVMQVGGMEPKDLDEIIVTKGPGSFTGVRIGLTTAKTMAWTLGIPIKTVSSLQALAYNVPHFKGKILTFFDARRERVYGAIFHWTEKGELKQVIEEENAPFTFFLQKCKEDQEEIMVLSPDLSLYQEMIEKVIKNPFFPRSFFQQPRAGVFGLYGDAMEVEPVHEVVPNYLRLAEAEANWLERQKQDGSNRTS